MIEIMYVTKSKLKEICKRDFKNKISTNDFEARGDKACPVRYYLDLSII